MLEWWRELGIGMVSEVVSIRFHMMFELLFEFLQGVYSTLCRGGLQNLTPLILHDHRLLDDLTDCQLSQAFGFTSSRCIASVHINTVVYTIQPQCLLQDAEYDIIARTCPEGVYSTL